MIRRNVWKNERLLIVILLVFYLLIRLPLLDHVPFFHDEPIYSMMVEEQVENPTLVPTFLGHEVGWKPPLFFWVYAIITRLTILLPISIDAVYRLPTVLFGLLNVVLVFQIVKKMNPGKEVAFFTSLIYVFTFLVIYTDTLVMTDTLAMTFIFGSILAYLHSNENQKLFLLAGVLSFLAFLTKQINAVVAPIFIAAYFYPDKKKLLHPLFLVSLLFIPAAFLLNYFMFSSSEQAYSVYSDLITKKIIEKLNIQSFYDSVAPFFSLISIWLPLSIFGFVKFWRENKAMSLWYLLIMFPIIAGTLMPFYYLPVMLPVAYFSALLLLRNEKNEIKADRFFLFVLALMLVTSIALGLHFYSWLSSTYIAQKEAGELLMSKENVMVAGTYSPGIIGYKALNEKRQYGQWLDFGWVLAEGSQETLDPFISDYHVDNEEVVEGSFAKMFFEAHIYRKDTNITEFDYVVLVGNETLTTNGTLLYSRSNVKVFKR